MWTGENERRPPVPQSLCRVPQGALELSASERMSCPLERGTHVILKEQDDVKSALHAVGFNGERKQWASGTAIPGRWRIWPRLVRDYLFTGLPPLTGLSDFSFIRTFHYHRTSNAPRSTEKPGVTKPLTILAHL